MNRKLYKREVYKSKEEWLNNRGFGGSSASAIVDKNPWMSKLELFKATVLKKSKPINETNEAMQYGTRCEKLIRDLFALDHEGKYKVHNPKNYEMYRRIDKPYMTATVDGLLRELDGNGRKGILEIKTHDIRNYDDELMWRQGLPDNYYIQCLHYLLVLNDCEYVILNAKLRFYDYVNGKRVLKKQEIIYHYIERSEVIKELEWLEKKETEFYENNILKRILPQQKISF